MAQVHGGRLGFLLAPPSRPWATASALRGWKRCEIFRFPFYAGRTLSGVRRRGTWTPHLRNACWACLDMQAKAGVCTWFVGGLCTECFAMSLCATQEYAGLLYGFSGWVL